VRLYPLAKDRTGSEVGSDAIPDTAGGQGGHGDPLNRDGVIHRYISKIVFPTGTSAAYCEIKLRASNSFNLNCWRTEHFAVLLLGLDFSLRFYSDLTFCQDISSASTTVFTLRQS